jgi:hypothetical protein
VIWILSLVKTGAAGEVHAKDVMRIDRPDDLGDIANLGLPLSEAKQLRAALQQEIVAAQAKTHAVLRPNCPCGRGVRHVKDYRERSIATLFSQVPRFSVRSWCGFLDFGTGSRLGVTRRAPSAGFSVRAKARRLGNHGQRPGGSRAARPNDDVEGPSYSIPASKVPGYGFSQRWQVNMNISINWRRRAIVAIHAYCPALVLFAGCDGELRDQSKAVGVRQLL